MTPYEMMLSESQERMLFVIEPKHEAQAKEIFDRWGIICAKVGKVTDDGVDACSTKAKRLGICRLRRWLMSARYTTSHLKFQLLWRRSGSLMRSMWKNTDLKGLHRNPGLANVASKEWVYNQYDYMVRTSTAVQPGSDAAVVQFAARARACDGDGL